MARRSLLCTILNGLVYKTLEKSQLMNFTSHRRFCNRGNRHCGLCVVSSKLFPSGPSLSADCRRCKLLWEIVFYYFWVADFFNNFFCHCIKIFSIIRSRLHNTGSVKVFTDAQTRQQSWSHPKKHSLFFIIAFWSSIIFFVFLVLMPRSQFWKVKLRVWRNQHFSLLSKRWSS